MEGFAFADEEGVLLLLQDDDDVLGDAGLGLVAFAGVGDLRPGLEAPSHGNFQHFRRVPLHRPRLPGDLQPLRRPPIELLEGAMEVLHHHRRPLVGGDATTAEAARYAAAADSGALHAGAAGARSEEVVEAVEGRALAEAPIALKTALKEPREDFAGIAAEFVTDAAAAGETLGSPPGGSPLRGPRLETFFPIGVVDLLLLGVAQNVEGFGNFLKLLLRLLLLRVALRRVTIRMPLQRHLLVGLLDLLVRRPLAHA
mmetsp:Transcript_29099/g.93857  ORF Transcript_29099/g.93857 Transcript_29099/m.93857 type:complete len:256 (+) Transcript_29099:503-1270(+)